ncbi:excinuclease ABC subunit UvrC [Salinibacterium sp. SYSU T00001]|uniref:excinuclease ABC subunit UvrC n=1 Tax=Homoserinimonas sedimenticola TaxID=2986805 RepID=UPI002235FF78|nr:excinuclease ABC subunit UvrC [Salinibacterium sedimenticola]MCW4384392.1 excinuclease ABC subunit UvrC [Salinibacterium sedimenticola]
MSDTVPYRPKAGEIPTEPGVYRFKDARQRVLYVGKAKNLRARLSNYFAPLPSLHERTRRMVTTAASVEWTVVGTEFEALQLEFTWIKEFDPPFNVQFRDDKSYPYLAITLQEDVPRVLVTRNKGIRGARYFGPYTKVGALRETVDLMLKAFPMRSCSDTIYRRAEQAGRPCLLGDIGKCSAPCVGRVTKGEHKSTALDFASFMAGQDRRYVNELTDRMMRAAEEQDYEAAAKLRDQRSALETVLSKNSMVLSDSIDADLFGIAHDELAAAVQQFSVRGGRIRGVRSWVVDKELDLELPELVESVLQKAYGDDAEPPRRVIVPALPDDAAELEHWLATRRWELTGRSAKSTLSVARRGELAALAQTVDANAKNALVLYKTRRSGDFTARSQALADIQDALGMPDAPLRMECFDVSHLSGTNIVASMVVFEDGLPRKDQYRKFSIQEAADDTAAIADVLRRRLAHLDDEATPLSAVAAGTADSGAADTDAAALDAAPVKRFAYRPNLLIVDGGQPQVAAASAVLKELGITDIALCGIAKRLEEVWLPGSEYPVILPRNSEALFLIQRIRDEAHRFAISFQRLRRKRDIHSVLSEIPGVGPSRVALLLKHFGSVARLRDAVPEQIAEVKGIGPALATTIHSRLRSSGGAGTPAASSAAASDE